MKGQIEFDGKSQAIDVIGNSEVGRLYLKIYWRDIDQYGNPQEHLRYTTNYMTKKEAIELSDLLRRIADEMGGKTDEKTRST